MDDLMPFVNSVLVMLVLLSVFGQQLLGITFPRWFQVTLIAVMAIVCVISGLRVLRHLL